jgi:hypothetical protein
MNLSTILILLETKDESEQSHLLDVAKRKAQELRENHKGVQIEVMNKAKEKLLLQKKEHDKRVEDQIRRKTKVAKEVADHGGPCLSMVQFNKLIQESKKKELKKRLRAEILYRKVVLGSRNKMLKVSGTITELIDRIKQVLVEEDGNCETQDVVISSNSQISDLNDEPVLDTVEPCEQPSKRARLDFNIFHFTEQGTWVAVYYDDDYYIGQVVQVLKETKAVINFMQKCGVRKNLLKWPTSPDVDEVDASYVIAWGIPITTQNGRFRTLYHLADDEYDRLDTLFNEYKRMNVN